jgi:hypothetical protein
MIELKHYQLGAVSGGHTCEDTGESNDDTSVMEDVGYGLSFGFGYLFSGRLGRELGRSVYDMVNG